MTEIRIPNVKQAWVPWDAWECFEAGMYDSDYRVGHDFESFKKAYADFLADNERFRAAAIEMASAWPLSCKNFLTNKNINRIAWIGQASACYELGLSSAFRGGFWLLTPGQQSEANRVATCVLRDWIIGYNETEDSRLREGMDRQMLFEWHFR